MRRASRQRMLSGTNNSASRRPTLRDAAGSPSFSGLSWQATLSLSGRSGEIVNEVSGCAVAGKKVAKLQRFAEDEFSRGRFAAARSIPVAVVSPSVAGLFAVDCRQRRIPALGVFLNPSIGLFPLLHDISLNVGRRETGLGSEPPGLERLVTCSGDSDRSIRSLARSASARMDLGGRRSTSSCR